MSIYSTFWHLQFPRSGDAYAGCEWVEVFAQGVPAHVGTPTPGYGYESGDPYATFLPPALRLEDGAPENNLRAVVFIVSTTKKGTTRAGQEYESPFLVLTGAECAAMPFQDLHDRLCDALRGPRPRLVLQVFVPDSPTTLVFEDGSTGRGRRSSRTTRGRNRGARCSDEQQDGDANDTADDSWFAGPPYAVPEEVFDEYSIVACTLDPDGDGPGAALAGPQVR